MNTRWPRSSSAALFDCGVGTGRLLVADLGPDLLNNFGGHVVHTVDGSDVFSGLLEDLVLGLATDDALAIKAHVTTVQNLCHPRPPQLSQPTDTDRRITEKYVGVKSRGRKRPPDDSTAPASSNVSMSRQSRVLMLIPVAGDT